MNLFKTTIDKINNLTDKGADILLSLFEDKNTNTVHNNSNQNSNTINQVITMDTKEENVQTIKDVTSNQSNEKNTEEAIVEKDDEKNNDKIEQKEKKRKKNISKETTEQKSFLFKTIAISILVSMIFSVLGSYIYGHLIGGYVIVNRGTVTMYEVPSTDKEIKYEENTIPFVVNKVQNSIVAITTSTLTNSHVMGQYVKEGAGSGVIVSKDGYIVTNTHVIKDANNITVKLPNGKEYPAEIVGSDIASDISVLKIKVNNLSPAVFGDSKKLIVGETLIAIGNPLGELGGTVTSGILSAKDRELTLNSQTMNLLQFSAAINPGNSGGGLFNLNGELIGIVNAKTSGSEVEGLGFAIPSNNAKEIITELIETGKVSGRPEIGIATIEIQNTADSMKYVDSDVYSFIDSNGIYISESDNPHLFIGDKIIAVDGEAINTIKDLENIINKKKVDDTIELTITRNKNVEVLEITLREKK